MSNPNFWERVAAVFVMCAALAVASDAQTLITLVNFDGTKGSNPYSSLVQGADGNLYGSTYSGGQFSGGTLFRVTPEGA